MDVVDTDKFLEMPASTQSLYFHLGMRADDEGFVSAPKKITKLVNCGEDDLKLLLAKGYILTFDSGVVVITDWKINNWIRPDRKHESRFKEELSLLSVSDEKYTIADNLQSHDNQLTTKCHTEVRLGEVSIGKKTYTCAFESFWNAYPRKKEKAKTYKCYHARLNDGYSEDELLTAAIEYAKECKARSTEERYIKLGATFLSASTPFADYLKADVREAKTEPMVTFGLDGLGV